MVTLSERIKAADQQRNVRPLRPSEPVEFRPRWLARLQPKDMTDTIYSNGAWQRRDDGGAA